MDLIFFCKNQQSHQFLGASIIVVASSGEIAAFGTQPVNKKIKDIGIDMTQSHRLLRDPSKPERESILEIIKGSQSSSLLT